MPRPVLPLCLLLLCLPLAGQELKVHALFGHGMVLQRESAVPVWGWAAPGEQVAVSFADQQVKAVAGPDGLWRAVLTAMPASAEGRPLVIRGARSGAVELQDVLVGDVFLASGQSNMGLNWEHKSSTSSKPPQGRHPLIRLWRIGGESFSSKAPLLDYLTEDAWLPRGLHAEGGDKKAPLRGEPTAPARWALCDETTARPFSMVAYHFALELRRHEDVPIGLIAAARGGTLIGSWFPQPGATAKPVRTFRPELLGDKDENFNGMISPLVGFALKGVLWYQGENEANWSFDPRYGDNLRALIRDWRGRWDRPDLPFCFVQIQRHGKKAPEIMELQMQGLREPATAMAVCFDACTGLHPANKEEVGQRLARGALAVAYGRRDIEWSGPLYQGMRVEQGRARLRFAHLGGGLELRERAEGGKGRGDKAEPPPFLIAGATGDPVPAQAQVDGDELVVWSEQVAQPVRVHYAVAGGAAVLWNRAGLPAPPFRTEAWTDGIPGPTRP